MSTNQARMLDVRDAEIARLRARVEELEKERAAAYKRGVEDAAARLDGLEAGHYGKWLAERIRALAAEKGEEKP